MLKIALWLCLYAFLIFWSLEAVYMFWQFYRNDALPCFRFWRGASPSRPSPSR
jgi:hypothetical protein